MEIEIESDGKDGGVSRFFPQFKTIRGGETLVSIVFTSALHIFVLLLRQLIYLRTLLQLYAGRSCSGVLKNESLIV